MKKYLCLLLIAAGCAAHRPAPVVPATATTMTQTVLSTDAP